MGFWPLDQQSGGIAWGDSTTELMWGDSMADIVDVWSDKPLIEVFKKCNQVYLDHPDINRELTPREFLCGLAFSLNNVQEHPHLNDLFGDLDFSLRVDVLDKCKKCENGLIEVVSAVTIDGAEGTVRQCTHCRASEWISKDGEE